MCYICTTDTAAPRKAHPWATCIATTLMCDAASSVGAQSAGADGYFETAVPAGLIRQLEQLSIGRPALSPAVALNAPES